MSSSWKFRESQYQEVNRTLKRYFRSRFPEEDPHDLAAATWTAVVRRYKGEGSLSGFVFTVAKRFVADRHRKADRKGYFVTQPTPGDGFEAMEPLASRPGLETLMALGEAHAIAQCALETVPEVYRSAVALWLEGLDNFEIAAELGVNYNTARSRLSRGLAVLRAELDVKFDG